MVVVVAVEVRLQYSKRRAPALRVLGWGGALQDVKTKLKSVSCIILDLDMKFPWHPLCVVPHAGEAHPGGALRGAVDHCAGDGLQDVVVNCAGDGMQNKCSCDYIGMYTYTHTDTRM